MRLDIATDGSQSVVINSGEAFVGSIDPQNVYTFKIASPQDLANALEHFAQSHDTQIIHDLIGKGHLTSIYTVGGNLMATATPFGGTDDQIFKLPRKSYETEQRSPLTQMESDPERFAREFDLDLTDVSGTQDVVDPEKLNSQNWSEGIPKPGNGKPDARQVSSKPLSPEHRDEIIERLALTLASEMHPRFDDLNAEHQQRITETLLNQLDRVVSRDIRKIDRAEARREKFVTSWSKRTGIEESDPAWDSVDPNALSHVVAWSEWALGSFDVIGEAAEPHVSRGLEAGVQAAKATKQYVVEHPREIALATVATAILAGGLPPTNSPDFASSKQDAVVQTVDGQEISFAAPVQETSLLTVTVENNTTVHAIAKMFGSTDEQIFRDNLDADLSPNLREGTTLKVKAAVSVITLADRQPISEIAQAFNLDPNAIAALNGASSASDQLEGDVLLVGRMGLNTNGTPDLERIAQATMIDKEVIGELNALAPKNTVVLPTNLTGTYPEDELRELSQMVDNSQVLERSAIDILSPAEREETREPGQSPLQTTTTVVPADASRGETKPEPPQAPVISAEVQRVNDALANIKLGQPNDLTELTEAVKAMYDAYAPNDPHRRADLPEGYVKLMLLNEAPGLAALYTVAERTANLERYTSPEMFAAFLAQAKIYQDLVETKYPQFAGSMLRTRDANSPNHGTHNHGQMLDTSSQMSFAVTQYSDGPFADSLFSENYDEAFTIDMYVATAGFSTRGVPTFRRIISSKESVVGAVNAQVGTRFMGYDDGNDHLEHAHYIANDAFVLPTWGLRARDLPWGTDQDLRVGSMAQPIDPAIIAQEHSDFFNWLETEMDNTDLGFGDVEGPIFTSPEEPAQPVDSNAPTIDDKGIVTPKDGNLPALSVDQLPEIARTTGKRQLEETKNNGVWNVYEQIEAQTGVPAAYMFAIHGREGSNQPDQSMWAGEEIGARNPDTGQVMGDDLLNNGIKAAEHFITMAKNVYGIEVTNHMTPDDLALTFLAYNRGEMYDDNAIKITGEAIDPLSSPYPMNFYLSAEPMKFIDRGHFANGNGISWGEPERVQGRVNQSVGALAMVSVAGGFDHFHLRALAAQAPQASEPRGSNTPASSLDDGAEIRVTDTETIIDATDSRPRNRPNNNPVRQRTNDSDEQAIGLDSQTTTTPQSRLYGLGTR